MTRQRAHAELGSAIDELWAAVCELVLIALEDAPSPSDLAVVDDLVNSVSGLQGDVVVWRDLLARSPSPLDTADAGPVAASAGRDSHAVLAVNPRL